MKTLCAWCGLTIKESTTNDPSAPIRISHGICLDCMVLQLKTTYSVEKQLKTTEENNNG